MNLTYNRSPMCHSVGAIKARVRKDVGAMKEAAENVLCASGGMSQRELSVTSKGAKNQAYILVETVVGRSLEVSRALRDRDWAATVERMVGAFDIMVVAKGVAGRQTPDRIKTMIEQIDGVLRVVVCPLSPANDTSWRS